MAADNANDRIRDLQLRHEIRTRRFSRDVSRRIARLLEKSNRDARDRLAARLARTIDTGPWTTAHTQALVNDLAAEARKWRQIAEPETAQQLRDFAADEAAFQAGTLNRNTPVAFNVVSAAPELLRAAVTTNPIQGRLMSEWFGDLEAAQVRGMTRAVRMGVVEGKSIRDIARDLRDVADLGKRQAETVAKTAVSTITDKAREETFKANADVLKGEQWVSTLDGRTCVICMGLDGKLFSVGEGPRPPEHPACRCVRIPITKSWEELGIEFTGLEGPPGSRPFVRSTGPVAGIPEARRGELIGNVPGTMTYPDWLRQQPREFVEEVLGKTRARLFLDGKLSIERFVDNDLRPMTLNQLRAAHPEALDVARIPDVTVPTPAPPPLSPPRVTPIPWAEAKKARGNTYDTARAYAENDLGIQIRQKGPDKDWANAENVSLEHKLLQLDTFNDQAAYLATWAGRDAKAMFKNIAFIPAAGEAGGLAHIGAREITTGPGYVHINKAWDKSSVAHEDMVKRAEKNRRENNGRKFFVEDLTQETSASATVRHELAHSLTTKKVRYDFMGRLGTQFPISRDPTVKLSETDAIRKRWFAENVSVYSAENEWEMIAEAVAMVTAPYYKKSATMKWLEDFVEDMLTGKIDGFDA